MKNPILLSILFLASFFVISQETEISYTYDAAGNRIAQQVIYLKSAEINPQDSAGMKQEKTFTGDLAGCKVSIFPNPTKGQLRVELTGMNQEEAFNAEVFRQDGSLLLRREKQNSSAVIDLSSAGKGIYILQLTLREKKRSWKVVKE
jgi:hypothetical protein